ncbi:L-rhamnose mutarotase [Herbaspirillum sp. RTI4]|uniref:L-rhamnose mutarotase n=1 Tax=Herbaspirillum sp. RTI4 TaxID=3048640 RepID=UPI002AB3C865|nr:L-rhamnose mutarotase [Herbaspirillum sp. RTI4]MDY7578768.1 L-rhamnose mutarotase [Herbaspirillum sp. RTI4]MEA9982312.1 L-rhamnose mutarotase [Herbaspirillum sp. RTI4]
MQRMGMMIGIKPDKIDEYKTLHAAVWPTVLNALHIANIKNFSIFLREPENLLFSYWEYVGNDFDADMRQLAQDPQTQQWWLFCDPCQVPLASRADGEHWATMKKVFHMD